MQGCLAGQLVALNYPSLEIRLKSAWRSLQTALICQIKSQVFDPQYLTRTTTKLKRWLKQPAIIAAQ